MIPTMILSLVLVATSVLSVLGALFVAVMLDASRRKRGGWASATDAIFLIEHRALVDANIRGTTLLSTLQKMADSDDRSDPRPEGVRSLELLCSFLAPSFPGVSSRIDDLFTEISRHDPALGPPPEVSIAAQDGSSLHLSVNAAAEGMLRVCVSDSEPTDATGGRPDALFVDRLSWRAMTEEVELLRRTSDLAPTPAWRENPDGEIVWANGAYLRLLREADTAGRMVWPLPRLFSPGKVTRPDRRSVAVGSRGRFQWFDLIEFSEQDVKLVFAVPADEAHRADQTRRDFVQTLTKTFATLPIGLAVFDRTRRLHLFNPALTDLTLLEPEFLSSRPGLDGFLNRMRDKRILPEPRDYRAWSRRLLDVETAGYGAGFEETWPLADGRTFRVSAAPHPDGALAFLIEDITADVHLKRSFRAELDTGQTALDMVDTALAMFSAGGDLVLTNAAFDQLWTLEGAQTLAGVVLTDAIANWRDASEDTEIWDRIANLAQNAASQTEIEGIMRLAEGEVFRVLARKSQNGSLMIAFHQAEPLRSLLEPARLKRASA